MIRKEANDLNDYYNGIVGKTYDGKYFNALVIVPENGENIDKLVYHMMHNEPMNASNLLATYDSFKVLAVADYDINTNQFAVREVQALAKEMEANDFEWSE
ncbi:hypothetical protein [Pedobacter miscanthi]|uniref:Uncharacterized protein n=1 Tax=Pedobacter miscanthi TaxID=2259170 RepID=A0A366KNF8_9SPHI|nr:hypothetical protein [Pedobacter miscanthi]RBQ02813.1 hypothetical protein DRW42_24495 [Pedobacter miscanthi]